MRSVNGYRRCCSHGHCDVINFMYSCWDDPDLTWARQSCRFFLFKAIAGGHVAVYKLLLSLYGDRLVLLPSMKQAVTLGKQKIVSTTISALNGKGVPLVDALLLTAKRGELNLMTRVLDTYPHAEALGPQAAYRVMLEACSHGYLDMVQFLNEKYGQRLYTHDGYDANTPAALAVAIANSHTDVAEYLYANNGFNPSFIDPVLSSAIDAGLLGLVKRFFDDGLLNGSESVLGKAFVCAAGSGQLAITKFLKSKSTFGVSDFFFTEAFMKAVWSGSLETVEFLYPADDHLMYPDFLDIVFMSAASSGQLEIVRFLDSKRQVSPDLMLKIFMETTLNWVLDGKTIPDRVGILEFLYTKAGVAPEMISYAFMDAVRSSSVEVVKFLYEKGGISADLVDEAFRCATCEVSADVVEFIYKTGGVSSKSVGCVFWNAVADDDDVYVLDCLFKCGCIPQTWVEDIFLHHFSTRSSRVRQFFHMKHRR